MKQSKDIHKSYVTIWMTHKIPLHKVKKTYVFLKKQAVEICTWVKGTCSVRLHINQVNNNYKKHVGT